MVWSLHYLTISLSATIPTEIGLLRNLTSVAMAKCGVFGDIPTELGNLKNLKLLAIMGNRLSGPIGIVLQNLTKLERIFIEHNAFTGPVSREQWSVLGNAEISTMYRNGFTGELPDDIGELFTNYSKIFDIEGNQFSGTIPASLALLPQLQWLDVSNNLFTGTIPDGLSATTTLALQGNNFTGSVPDSVCEAVTGRGGKITYECGGSLSCTCNCTCAGPYF